MNASLLILRVACSRRVETRRAE